MTDASPQIAPILVAEDEETDAMLLRWAFEKVGLPYRLIVVRDGQEAVDYLSGESGYADRVLHPLPCLLVLDLKMPRMSGFDVLAWLDKRPQFQDLPRIVLSSSSYESDIERARELGAWDFRTKPHVLHEFVQLVRELHVRWLQQPEPIKS
jgi:CheY-like chemotaxis protein